MNQNSLKAAWLLIIVRRKLILDDILSMICISWNKNLSASKPWAVLLHSPMLFMYLYWNSSYLMMLLLQSENIAKNLSETILCRNEQWARSATDVSPTSLAALEGGYPLPLLLIILIIEVFDFVKTCISTYRPFSTATNFLSLSSILSSLLGYFLDP